MCCQKRVRDCSQISDAFLEGKSSARRSRHRSRERERRARSIRAHGQRTARSAHPAAAYASSPPPCVPSRRRPPASWSSRPRPLLSRRRESAPMPRASPSGRASALRALQRYETPHACRRLCGSPSAGPRRLPCRAGHVRAPPVTAFRCACCTHAKGASADLRPHAGAAVA